jgi:hypothetical protein
VRAYVRRDLASVTDSVTLLSLEAVDDAVWYTDLFVLDDRAGVYLEWDSGSGDNGTESAPLDLSAGWTCLTWEIDMEAGAIRLAREGSTRGFPGASGRGCAVHRVQPADRWRARQR